MKKGKLLNRIFFAIAAVLLLAFVVCSGSYAAADESRSSSLNFSSSGKPLVSVTATPDSAGKVINCEISVSSGNSSGKVKVWYRTVNYTAIGGIDFEAVDATREIAPGTSSSFTVKIITNSDLLISYVDAAGKPLSGNFGGIALTDGRVKKQLYVEVYRADGGEIDADGAKKLVAVTPSKVNQTLDYGMKDKGMDIIKDGSLTYTSSAKSSWLYFNGTGSTGEMYQGDEVYSSSVNRSQFIPDNIYEYFKGIGAELVFNITGATGRKSIKGQGTVYAQNHAGFHLITYGRNEIGESRISQSYVYHCEQPFASDGFPNVAFDLARGTYYNGSKQMNRDAGYENLYYSATGNPYFAWGDADSIRLKMDMYDDYMFYWDKVWNCSIKTGIVDDKYPLVTGYYVTNTAYKLGDTINIAVKFNEPVFVKDLSDDPVDNPYITALFPKTDGSGGSDQHKFVYSSGSGTDTLTFSYTLKEESNTALGGNDAGRYFTTLTFQNIRNFNKICDLSEKKNYIPTNQYDSGNFAMYQGNPNNLKDKDANSVQLVLNVDTRTPHIRSKSAPDYTTTMKTATFTFTIENVGAGSAVRYCFNKNPDGYEDSELVSDSSMDSNYNVVISQSGYSGIFYLHVVATNALGVSAEWTSNAIYFDSTSPAGEITQTTSGYQALHKFKLSFYDGPDFNLTTGIRSVTLYFSDDESFPATHLGIDISGVRANNSETISGVAVARESDVVDGNLTTQTYGFEIGKDVIYENQRIFGDILCVKYLHVLISDNLNNTTRLTYANPILMDTRVGVGSEVAVTGNAYKKDTGFAGFNNAFYMDEANGAEWTYTGGAVYLHSFTINGAEVLPAEEGVTFDRTKGDWLKADGSLYDRYASYVTEETSGTKNIVFAALASGGADIRNGYYALKFKRADTPTLQEKAFYVSSDTLSSAELSEDGLTQNVENIDTLKLIKSKYWVTARDYIYRRYNKNDPDSYEGTGFRRPEGEIEAVKFLGEGKYLVYASYSAALSDQIARERKDISKISNPTPSLIATINQSTNLNADNKTYTMEDTIYYYKPKSFSGTEEYCYYASNESGAIVEALLQNARKTVGANPNNKETNGFRSINDTGIGFDISQIVDVPGYTIFDNYSRHEEYGNCPIASSVIIKEYCETFAATEGAVSIPTEIYYRMVGTVQYYRINIPRAGIALKDVLTTSGFYELVEMSEKGASFRRVYIDCTAPQLYGDLFKGSDGTTVDKDYFDKSDDGVAFYLSRLNLSRIVDMDENTLLAIYEAGSIGNTLLATYTLADLESTNSIILKDTRDLLIYVYDRSGNSIRLDVKIATSDIRVTKTDYVSTESYVVNIDNRRSSDIVSSELYFNDELTDGYTYDNTRELFLTSVTLYSSGVYYWRIVDKYGYVYEETFEYTKIPPTGEFYAFNEDTGRWDSLKNTDRMLYDEATGAYVIRSRTALRFLYTNKNYTVDFFNIDRNLCIPVVIEGTTMNPVMSYGYEIPASNSSWSLKLGYAKDPYVFTLFTCAIDTVPPVVYGEYVAAEQDGQRLTQSVYNGAVVNAEKVYIKWYDNETEVMKIEVAFDGGDFTTFTDLTPYATDGFLLAQEGLYTVRAYDLLGNVSEISVTLDRSVDVTITDEGETVEPDDGVYYTSGSVLFYINEPLTFEFGDMSVSFTMTTITYSFYAAENNPTVTFPLALTAEERDNPNITFVEKLIISDGEKCIYYGVTKAGDVYLKFDAPKITENNEWNEALFETFAYEMAVYDSIGDCTVDASSFMEGQEEGAGDFESVFSTNGIPYTLSKTNARVYKFELSNRKFTPGFTDTDGIALNDVRESAMGRYNVNFKLDAEELNRLIADGSLTEISFRYAKKDVAGSGAEYTRLYPAGSTTLAFNADGEYEFVFAGKYGVVFTQYIRLGKTISAQTFAIYADGGEREIELVDNLGVNTRYVYGNFSIRIAFNNLFERITVTKDNTDVTRLVQINYDSDGFPYIVLTGDGRYVVDVEDSFGNALRVEGEISRRSGDAIGIDVKSTLNNWNADALRGEENYTNRPLGFANIGADIFRIEYAYYTFESYASGGEFTLRTLYDRYTSDFINRTTYERIGADENGNTVNGVYAVRMFDRYGNACELVVHISNSPQIVFEKKMTDDPDYNPVDYLTVRTFGLNSNYSWRISVTGGRYLMTVDGDRYEGDGPFSQTRTAGDLVLTTYKVYFVDEYGNSFDFNAAIDRKQPLLSFVDDTIFTLIDNVLTTREYPSLLCDKANVTVTYTINDGQTTVYRLGDLITADGYYVVTVTDYAGNTSIVTFKIDTRVEYKAYASSLSENYVLPQGILVNDGRVTFGAEGNDDAVYVKSALKNGEAMEVTDNFAFTETGEYTVTLTDKIGNEANFSFRIVKNALPAFTYTAPQGYTFLKVEILENNTAISANHLREIGTDGRETVTAGENMTIRVTCTVSDLSITNQRFTFTVTTDVTAPYLELVNAVNGGETKKDVSFTAFSENCTVYVYKDGALLTEKVVAAGGNPDIVLSENGIYRVVIMDEAGNTAEYSFERIFTMNTWAIIVIIVAFIVVVVGIIVFLRIRNKTKAR